MSQSKVAMVLPFVALRGLTVFPDMVIHFDVGREKSVAALEEAMMGNQLICVAAQKDVQVKDPKLEDVYSVGTVGRIKQIIKLPGMNIRLLVEGLYRVRVVELTKQEPYLEALVEKEAEDYEPTAQTEAYAKSAVALLKEYAKINGKISNETLGVINGVKDHGRLADLIATNVLSTYQEKQEILELFDPEARLARLVEMLNRLIEVAKIEQQINSKVKQQMDKVQREYYLNEQLRAIQSELGDKDITGEVEELEARLAKTPVSDEARAKAEKELSRMKKMTQGSPETSVIRSYVEWILDLPWGIETEDNRDLTRAQEILEEDHFGLEKVKERVLEYLAVCSLTGAMKGPILCFVGPPGVGKTSIAKSIARALDRKFVRMSLGGVRDEAEIRGHRRTYIGAIPGNIISSIKQAG
ncbi:MAG: LON peptidase substrate-binding domain-containing protein, partial [Clostridia bacterium]|nr:LON peptidase substrate-binding domain-containing protein [Clostridia bacterium]